MMKRTAYKTNRLEDRKSGLLESPKEELQDKKGRKTYKVPTSMLRPIFVLWAIGIMFNL